jgi:hypothetical protein
MKTDMTTTPAPAASANYSSDSAKLVSLLAMATGAVAMPQVGNADIIYTDLNSSPKVVGYGGDDSFLFSGLPGSVQFGFKRQQIVTTSTSSIFGSTFTITYRTVIAGDSGGGFGGIRGAANGFAAPLAPGASWNAGGVNTFYNVAVGTASNLDHRPTFSYDHNYLAWVFADSSQGNALRYGWVEISLSIGNITGNPASGPNVTIWGYAWDNTGAKPAMGDMPVPEPSSGALMVFGAMALGSRGLRNWRRNRDTVSKS